MKLMNTKTDWAIVKAYINENHDKMKGMTILMEGWDCKENNSEGDFFDLDNDGQIKNTNEYRFELDEITFNEITEFMEEAATSVILQIIHHEKFIKSAVAINKKPIPINSFIQIQKKIREYMDQQLESQNFEGKLMDAPNIHEQYLESQSFDDELIEYKKAMGF